MYDVVGAKFWEGQKREEIVLSHFRIVSCVCSPCAQPKKAQETGGEVRADHYIVSGSFQQGKVLSGRASGQLR